ncbi:hypothetical protein ATO12_09940 [Aquimarina atlantica]|uniref:SMODS and SLOG-associating 2TM effector domain-containing protein n=1 Tax=Aquimarina atlantica TaxID=1317122 RepID=A0A023BZJ8_9FLAO|nr:hypothetical protein [Aquimarina atlantica]EZH75038.1 hypothetical protein ATO12_09940 [Aquimarina atlantica]
MEEIENISKGLKKELKFSNRNFKGWLDNLDIEVDKLTTLIKSKKTIAIVLKLIVVVSGILIASGFLKDLDIVVQIIGAVVLLITAIERVFANLDKLLSIVAAKNAFSRVRREIVRIHTTRLGPILGLKETEPEKAGRKIIELQEELIEKLIKVDDEIKTNLENKNYELLGRLTLEEKE